MDRLWGSAFDKKPKELAVLFAAGRDVKSLPAADEVLIPYEIKASKAWAKALFDQKIIDKDVLNKLLQGLDELQELYDKGEFKLDPLKEDVHTNVESFLTNKFGIDVAGKIHSGRSRSEQGVVDVLLYMKDFNEKLKTELKALIKTINKKSQQHKKVILPAYTHHQHATVTTFGNMLDSYGKALEKDLEKLNSWNELEEISPLGSAAAYGTTFPIDKNKINEYLGLKKVFKNEIQVMNCKGDAETLMVFNLAMLMNHLSSLAQTLIIFSTKEFGFVKISDEYSTGSSIMPQKKNPDPLEVMKAKASMCHGYLMSLLSMSKAPFIGYNRDSQWVKYIVMDAIQEVKLAPKIMKGVIETLEINKEMMQKQVESGFILAQGLMEALSMNKKIPMRQAKIAVEKTVKQSENNFELDVLNKNLNTQVTKQEFESWLNPETIAKKQMKK
ncbi:MAG: Fumarate hydratase class II [Candidatus Woesearchaeota archaeon]|nr:Fumarate hydratase class II [Candidatus Woesearchaeota archaeon]